MRKILLFIVFTVGLSAFTLDLEAIVEIELPKIDLEKAAMADVVLEVEYTIAKGAKRGKMAGIFLVTKVTVKSVLLNSLDFKIPKMVDIFDE
jgi:hypothetical protein